MLALKTMKNASRTLNGWRGADGKQSAGGTMSGTCVDGRCVAGDSCHYEWCDCYFSVMTEIFI